MKFMLWFNRWFGALLMGVCVLANASMFFMGIATGWTIGALIACSFVLGVEVERNIRI